MKSHSASIPTCRQPAGGFILRWLVAAWALAMLAGPPQAQAADKLLVGPQEGASALQTATARAKDGDTIEVLPGEYAGGVILVNRRLTLRGVGGGTPVIKGDGKAGSLQALLTVRGGAVTLENLEFRGARSQEGGGAGVRQEGGQLTLRGCSFFDNEHAVYATNDEAAELHIDSSVLGMAPRVVGGLYHLLSVGRIAKLTINGSRFQQGFEGHLIKSRARVNDIRYNFIHDGQRGGASYEIEIANGGLATIIGNVIGQGADSQNPVVVAYGTEGRSWDRNALYFAHNTLVNYGWLPAWFLRVIDKNLPPDTPVHAVNNLLVGPGVFWLGASGHFEGNRQTLRSLLRDADTYGFELAPGSMWRGAGIDPRQVDGQDLSPRAEFKWPVGIEPLAADLGRWSPGAYQR
jgi:hypothetical protein